MPDRRARKSDYTIDLILLTAVGGQLAVMLARAPEGREKWMLPWDGPRPGETMEASATRITRSVGVGEAAWLEQVGAYGDGKRHPADSEVSVGYAALIAMGTPTPVGGTYAWFPLGDIPQLAPRQRMILDGGIAIVRGRMDQSPVAFKLLPQVFTLTELQQMYDSSLERPQGQLPVPFYAWISNPHTLRSGEGDARPLPYSPARRRRGVSGGSSTSTGAWRRRKARNQKKPLRHQAVKDCTSTQSLAHIEFRVYYAMCMKVKLAPFFGSLSHTGQPLRAMLA